MYSNISVYLTTIHKLEIDPSRFNPSERFLRIINHYQYQFESGRMGYNEAINRCMGDLAGRNYNPKCLPQRSEIRL
jgi:hypothetical protein